MELKTETLFPRVYCTLFDDAYYAKGLAMIRSLFGKSSVPTVIFVMNMNRDSWGNSFNHLSRDLGQIMKGVYVDWWRNVADEALLKAFNDRTHQEFCWTSASWYLRHLLHRSVLSSVRGITYLDADLFFFGNPESVHAEIGERSIAAIPHRFPDRYRLYEANGKFNVSWVTIAKTWEGKACIDRWANQCIDWCRYETSNGKMADQKYLDEWPSLYGEHFHEIQSIGAGCAPWNAFEYKLASDGNGKILADGVEVVFYHFHAFKDLSEPTKYPTNVEQLKLIYQPYAKAVGVG